MMDLVILWTGVLALFGLGLVGIFVPMVPGIGLVFGGVLLYAMATGFASISVSTIVVLGVITLLAWLADYIGAAVGAKYGGGGMTPVLGSVMGSLIGLFLGGPAGLFAGAFAGALAGALYEGQSIERAGRVALYAVFGTLGATIVQLVLAVSIIGAFVIAIVT